MPRQRAGFWSRRRLRFEALESRRLLAVWVNPDGSADYTTIQAAIDDVPAGDTINVEPATYTEDLIINKADLTIQSTAGRDQTTIQLVDGVGIEVPAVGSGLTLGGGANSGFEILSGGTTSRLVELTGGPSDVTISYNKLVTIGDGLRTHVSASDATGLTIDQNVFLAGNVSDTSIIGTDLVDLRVRDNELIGAGVAGVSARAIYVHSVTNSALSESVISGNRIENYPTGIVVLSGTTGTSDLKIDDNTLEGCGNGIVLSQWWPNADMTDVTVTNNTMTGCDRGLSVGGGSQVLASTFTIQNNTFTGNTVGLTSSHNTEVLELSQNDFSGNTTYAVQASGAAEVDARLNWWGDASGPGGAGPGSGDAVSTNVLYSPWVGAPFDFGDAPAPYPTLEADNGPSHAPTGPTLGAARDSETDGLPTAAADGDDLDASDDEDGVTFGSAIVVGQLDASVTVNVQDAPSGAKLDAWIDFNADGCWGGPGEQIADGVAVGEGDNTLQFDVPSWAASGTTYARFRLSTAGNLAPTGPALDGEVEDYQLSINAPAAAGGLFGPQKVISDQVEMATSVVAVDVDGDGDMDVLSASYFDGKVSWYRNTDGEGSFGPQQVITSEAEGAWSVYAVDVDGDGDMDVFSNSYDKIAWYENADGGGTFGPQQVISSEADMATSVFAVDVDGDGDMDVVSGSYGDDKVAWYENTDGEGTFGPQRVISSEVSDAWSVYAADVDGDGDMDVVSASRGDGKIAWHENTDGGGTFGPQQVISSDAYMALSVVAVDVDGDGDMDVVSGSYGDGKVAWYENTDGEGSFGPQQVISSDAGIAPSVCAVDVDGDGDMDVLSASYDDGKVAWYRNTDGEGSFGPQRVISIEVSDAWSVYAADVDGDGDMDVVSGSGDKIAWYENHLSGDFGDAPAPYPTLQEDNGPRHALVGPTLGAARDSETDGLPTAGADGDDLDASDDEDGVTFGPVVMAGQLDAALTVNVANAPEGAKLDAWIDFNADGCWGGPGEQIADGVAVANGDNTVWFDVPSWAASGTTYARFRLSTAGDLAPTGPASDGEVEDYQVSIVSPAAASGQFGGPNVIPNAGDAPHSLFAADVDGDGHMDVLSVLLIDGDIAWYENDGSGNFTPRIIYDGEGDPRSVYAADLDGDGDLDVLSASQTDDTIAWYENTDGAGTFGDQQVITDAADGAYSVFAADVDGDGDVDVLSASLDDDTIAWYENTDGAGTFGGQQVIAYAADGAISVFAADVDSDGDLDVLSASHYGDTIAWYENDGTPGGRWDWREHPISTAADGAISVSAADIDSDGDADVLCAWLEDDTIAWYENDGSGNFTATHTVTDAAVEAYSVFAADVNGDGHVDILSASYGDDTVAWYENDGSGDFTEHEIFKPADGACSVFAADVDGDGRMDVVSASALDDTIAWYENLPADPWAIDFLELHLGVLSSGERSYSLQATHDGLLTVEAVAGGVSLQLYESGTPLPGSGQRVECTATAGTTYNLRMNNTTSQNVHLRLCNLVQQVGNDVTVFGTDGDDTVVMEASVDAGVVGVITRRVTINGVSYDLTTPVVPDPPVLSVTFDGAGGEDSAELIGTTGEETGSFYPGSGTFASYALAVDVTAETIAADGGGGSDTAKLYDSPGDDMLSITPDEASLTGPGYSNQVVGFGFVMGIARVDGYDTAKLEDSPGEDTFLGTPAYSKMSTGGETYAYAKSFEHVIGYSRAGRDLAILKDSPGDDKFVGRSTYGKLSGPGFKVQAQWFGALEACANSLGDDRAYLFDSPGDDWFIADSKGAVMQGVGFRNRARWFETAFGYGTGGGMDRAIFYDSPGNDTFVGTATKGRLTGPGYYLQAVRCDLVRAFSQSGGQDKARLFDSAGDDLLVATPEYSYLRGSPSSGVFKNRADGFAEVESTARYGGDDTARLYDSALNDYLHAEGNSAVLTWNTARVLSAYDFEQVEADASKGGVNLLRKVLPIDYVLLTTGVWINI